MDRYSAQAASWLSRRNVNIVSPSGLIILRKRLFFTCVAILRVLYGNLKNKIIILMTVNYFCNDFMPFNNMHTHKNQPTVPF